MAELPDLDPTKLGYIGYWNAIDQGGISNIDPTVPLSHANVTGKTVYDNGVDGSYALKSGREVRFRIKNDGWIILYTGRTNNYVQSAPPGNVAGYWDVVDWYPESYRDEKTDVMSPNAFAIAINTLRKEYDNSGAMDFSHSDVGLYNFEYSGATTTTALFAWWTSYGNAGEEQNPRFTYTSETDIKQVDAVGYGDSRGMNQGATSKFEGVTVASVGDSDLKAGALDATGQGYVSSPNTEYGHDLSVGYQGRVAAGLIHALWA